jgi:hypothetical protein
MDSLVAISKQYPQQVLSKIIIIAKDLKGTEDVVGRLQHMVISLGNSYPETFATEAVKFTKAEQNSLAAFLAGGNSDGFIKLGRQMKELGAGKLAGAFTKAAKDKEKQANE